MQSIAAAESFGLELVRWSESQKPWRAVRFHFTSQGVASGWPGEKCYNFCNTRVQNIKPNAIDSCSREFGLELVRWSESQKPWRAVRFHFTSQGVASGWPGEKCYNFCNTRVQNIKPNAIDSCSRELWIRVGAME